MKRFITICGVLAVAGMIAMPLTAQAEGVSVGIGDCKLMGIFQGNFTIANDGDETTDSFNFSRARLLLIGSLVPDKVKYIFQGDAANDGKLVEVTDPTTGDVTGYAYSKNPWLLDARMIFLNALPNTEIQVGRFLPNFTYYMPQLVSKLDFFDYPLLTKNYAMWRQVGIQTTTKFGANSLNVGILNSIKTQNTWSDADNWKDFLVRLNLNPNKMNAAVYALLGQTGIAGTSDYLLSIRAGGFVRAMLNEMVAQAEFLFANDEQAGDADAINGMALYVQAMYNASKKVAVGARFGYLEPNMDGDDDQTMRITAALNYMIEAINAMLSTNFIYDIKDPDNQFQIVEQAQVAF